MNIDRDALVAAARQVQQHAHARFSNYFVGAAVLDENGDVHVGCNVENASYPEGICAEANAIGSMVATGGRKIVAIAVVGDIEGTEGFGSVGPCTPCGGCRQRIHEFADDETQIIMTGDDGELHALGIDDLLPESFRVR